MYTASPGATRASASPMRKIRGAGFSMPTTAESRMNWRGGARAGLLEDRANRSVGVGDDAGNAARVPRQPEGGLGFGIGDVPEADGRVILLSPLGHGLDRFRIGDPELLQDVPEVVARDRPALRRAPRRQVGIELHPRPVLRLSHRLVALPDAAEGELLGDGGVGDPEQGVAVIEEEGADRPFHVRLSLLYWAKKEPRGMSKTRTVLAWCGSSLALALGLGLSAWAQQGAATRPTP